MPIVDGATRLYVIIGDPIAQVKSPEALSERFRAAGRNAILVPAHVPAAAFDAIVPQLLSLANLDGLIATVPFKQRIVPFCAHLLETGREVGAVNVLRRERDGTWTGDMLDGRGLVRGLNENGHKLEGRRALLIGAGGAGSAVGFALAQAGAASLTVHDVDAGRAERLAARVGKAYPRCDARVGAPDPAGHDILVNASPVGMREDDKLPAPLGRLDPALLVCDVVNK